MPFHTTIVLATANRHKVQELRALLVELPIELLSAADAGFTEEIEETGATLEENALLKARRVHEATGMTTLADDTGLEVDALHGAPGVRSARYAGDACSPADNRMKLLESLRDVPRPRRTACFRCVLALVSDRGEMLFEGRCDGEITTEERGGAGFGYDPVFQPTGDARTLAEMLPEEKHAISHRGRAARAFAGYMKSLAPQAGRG